MFLRMNFIIQKYEIVIKIPMVRGFFGHDVFSLMECN